MKVSRYNFIFKYNDNNHLFYNSFSNALALVENEKYEKFKEYLNENKAIDDDEFEKGLMDSGFLIEENYDEIKSIKLSLLKNRFSKANLSMVIAPTTNCNFRCTYCYEKNSNKESRMTPLVQEKIIDFCEENIKAGVKSINILWYGGEPLLTTDIIKNMSCRLIELCKKNNVSYSAGIITNGYCLNEKVIDDLKECKINNIQITLDGPKHIHDKRRFLVNGNPTFDEIIENVKKACEKYHITIRINIDKENNEELENLLKVLEENGLNKKIEVYLGFVEDTNDCYSKGSCMTRQSFSKSEHEFIQKIYDAGITKRNPWLSKYPSTTTIQCVADYINGFVISPNGDLYKCCCDIGVEDQKIGNILKINDLTHNNTLFKYLLYDPTEDEHCKNCKILPVCMGGCFKARDGAAEDRCSILKFNLKDYLIETAKAIESK